jgi:hypothetical protein
MLAPLVKNTSFTYEQVSIQKSMSEDEYNKKIENLANQITQDQTSVDEQDPQKLQKYIDYVKTNYQLEGELATQLVNEAFLYLKLKESKDADPIKDGDQFGAGFS